MVFALLHLVPLAMATATAFMPTAAKPLSIPLPIVVFAEQSALILTACLLVATVFVHPAAVLLVMLTATDC